MALCSSPSVFSPNPIPKIDSSSSSSSSRTCARVFLNQKTRTLAKGSEFNLKWGRNFSSTRLNATGFTEIEPDLNEDPIDRWETNSVSAEDFQYGIYDGHHTYYEGEETGTFWETFTEEIAGAGPPTGFQGFLAWIFLPAVAAGMYFHAPGEYLFIGAGLFTVVYCIIEMDKPDQPHNFEPQIYNMERGARDKLISDYNTMTIWDFNDKYGELWDFTLQNDNLIKP